MWDSGVNASMGALQIGELKNGFKRLVVILIGFIGLDGDFFTFQFLMEEV